jgi:hypothetical protein
MSMRFSSQLTAPGPEVSRPPSESHPPQSRNYLATSPQATHRNQGDVKVDHRFNDKNNVMVRTSISNSENCGLVGTWGARWTREQHRSELQVMFVKKPVDADVVLAKVRQLLVGLECTLTTSNTRSQS